MKGSHVCDRIQYGSTSHVHARLSVCVRANICPLLRGSVVVPNPTSAAEGWKFVGGGGLMKEEKES